VGRALRQAALILTDGWSHNTNARDDTGRIVPLFAGSGRSGINPAATKFSPYGAICKAASQSPKAQMTPAMWDVLQRLARDMGGRTGERNPTKKPVKELGRGQIDPWNCVSCANLCHWFTKISRHAISLET
jgi:hypothetical protein